MTTIKNMKPAALAGYAVRIGLALFGPFLLALFPGFAANNYTYSLLNFALIYSIVAIGLNLLTGFAGQISLGHSALLAIGAYTTAAMTSLVGLPFWVSLVIAGALTGVVGFLLALPALRLSGPYLAVATVGFAIAIPQVIKFLNFQSDGIEGLKVDKPNLPGFGPDDDLARYYMIMPVVALLYLLSSNLIRSKIGRAFLSIRESEIAAQAMGVGLARYKVTAFTVSAVMTGIAGALYVSEIGRVTADEFNLLMSISFLVMIIVGGLGTLGGSVAGAILMTVLPEFVNRLSNFAQESLNNAGFGIQLKNPQYVLYGILIILVVLYMPHGLAGVWYRLKERFWKSTPAAMPDLQAVEEVITPPGRAISGSGLEIKNMSIRFGGLTAVSDFSMAVKPGEIVGLIGPNGAGKTTVFNCISNFYRPNHGQIVWEGQVTSRRPPQEMLKLGVARTFQNVELFRQLSVMDNLLIGQHRQLKQNLLDSLLHTPSMRREEAQARRRALEILAFLKIAEVAPLPAASLPFGKQKQIELARALVSRPRLILLDEPAAGANNRETAELADLIRRVRDEFGITVLLVEHDMSLVMNLCERLYVLDFGKLIATGCPEEVQADPAVIEAYLGEPEAV
ncbi:MAG TPA: branched-chain amino acid ABC transporter ATP-binding protein/permease [Chloroflexia bacterium]|nr:branched-chain amino acid ABC transporter ATP-binding protein/permease [Chloroflexia bacterium]